jgi:hypothetical protein
MTKPMLSKPPNDTSMTTGRPLVCTINCRPPPTRRTKSGHSDSAGKEEFVLDLSTTCAAHVQRNTSIAEQAVCLQRPWMFSRVLEIEA